MSEDEIEVRELKTRDVFTVSKILLSLSDEAAQEISTIVSKEDLESDDEEEEKELFERLAQEENQHYKMLENTDEYLNENEKWFLTQEYGLLTGDMSSLG